MTSSAQAAVYFEKAVMAAVASMLGIAYNQGGQLEILLIHRRKVAGHGDLGEAW